jgi:hypothetical protein
LLRIFEGMFAREQARGALVIAADLTLGEFMQEKAALLVEGLGGDNLAAEIAEIGEPVAEVKWKLFVELFAELLGECRRVAGGGDGDLQVSAANDGGEVEVAERRVIDGVAEDAGCGGFGEDGAVDGRVVGGGDDEESSGKVALPIGSSDEGKFAGCGLLRDGGVDL